MRLVTIDEWGNTLLTNAEYGVCVGASHFWACEEHRNRNLRYVPI
jgi:hypothetical protein